MLSAAVARVGGFPMEEGWNARECHILLQLAETHTKDTGQGPRVDWHEVQRQWVAKALPPKTREQFKKKYWGLRPVAVPLPRGIPAFMPPPSPPRESSAPPSPPQQAPIRPHVVATAAPSNQSSQGTVALFGGTPPTSWSGDVYQPVGNFNPQRQMWVLGQGHRLTLPQAAIRTLVKHAYQLSGGSPDMRSNGSSQKIEFGYKATGKGQTAMTKWANQVGTGTSQERHLPFDEIFQKETAEQWFGTFARPFAPELRKGHEKLDEPELRSVMFNHTECTVTTKRELNPLSADQDEKATEPTVGHITQGGALVEIPIDIRFLGKPGVTGKTANLTLIYDSPQSKSQAACITHHPNTRKLVYDILNAFPPQSQGAMEMHADRHDQQKLEHLGMQHNSLSTLTLYVYDPYDIVIGGAYYALLGGPDARGRLPSQGSTIAISPRGLQVVAHQSQFNHMAGEVSTTRATTLGEEDIIRALQDDGPRVRTRFMDEHEPAGSKVVGVRGSLVDHTSKAPVRFAENCRRTLMQTGHPSFLMNTRQKHGLVGLGLIPLNANEKVRPKHRELRDHAMQFPINWDVFDAHEHAMVCERALPHKARILAMEMTPDGDDPDSEPEPDGEQVEPPEEPQAASEVDAGGAGGAVRLRSERIRKATAPYGE